MKKTIFVSMVIISMAVMGLATAQDFVSGEMKGSDAPQVFKIGGDDPADDLFVKTMQPVPLSGNNWSMFESMGVDWWMDPGVPKACSDKNFVDRLEAVINKRR